MIDPYRYLRAAGLFTGQWLRRANLNRGRAVQRSSRRRGQVVELEQLEDRIVPATATGLGTLLYTAAPGEANDFFMSPGFLTYISDAPSVTIVQAPPGFSANWLSAISLSIGVSVGVDISVSVPVIPFLLAQDGVFFPSIAGATDATTPLNFAGTIASSATQYSASVISGVTAQQAGDVFFKVTGSSSDVIDNYSLYQVVADPNANLGESGSITDINAAVFRSGSPGMNVTGTAERDETDAFVFNAVAGKRYVVMLDSDPERDGTLTSTSLKISNLAGFITGTPLQENLSISGYNAVGAIDATTSGPYFVQVENTGFGTDNSYRFVVLEVDPVADKVAEVSPVVASADVPKAIPDYSGSPGSVSSTLTVSGFTGVLTDVNATLNLTHTFDSDLIVKLKSPAGTEVTLINRVGNDGDNFSNTTLDDDFSFNPIGSGSAPFSSTFSPSSPLSAFNGENPNGVWTLTITDNASNDTGTLNSWSLKLTPTPPNDSTATATTLAPGKFGQGKIDPKGETDFWKASGVTATSLVYSYVDTNQSTRSKDSKLTLLANDGTTVLGFDDNSGPPGISRGTLNNLSDAFNKGGLDLNAIANTVLSGAIIDLGDRDDRADVSAFNTGVTIYGRTGNDTIIGSQGADTLDLGDGNDVAIGGLGADNITGGLGDDIITGGAGDDRLDGGDGNDTFIVDTQFASVDTIIGGPGDDLLFVPGSDFDDTVRIAINQLAANQVVIEVNGTVLAFKIDGNDVEQLHLSGGLGFDRLIVTDTGFNNSEVVQFYPGADGTSGLLKIGSNVIQITYDGFEEVVPLDGPLTRADHTARLVQFLPDPYEVNGGSDNDTLVLATHMGSGAVINVDPTIAVAGDVDYYQFVASQTGTLDFQVYFEQNVGLPGQGNLDIQVLDSTGDVIGSSASSDNNERVRIPAVQGQIYYLRVSGAGGTAINTYEFSVVNDAAPVPFGIELSDTQTTPPSVNNSDTGRSQFDNVTADNTPTILLRLADGTLLNDLPGNSTVGTPPDQVIPIAFNSSTNPASTTAGFRVAIFDESNAQAPVPLGFAQPVGGQPGVYSFTFGTPLADGSHLLTARVQMIDPALPAQSGFGAFSQALEIVVDTLAPPTVQAANNRLNLDLDATSDTGLVGVPSTSADRITQDTTPTFFGAAEANSIVRLYAADALNNLVLIGQTVASPNDGTNQTGQSPAIGRWEVTSNIDLNSPTAGFARDGVRRIVATFEDVAGNVSAPIELEILLDTQSPQVTAVQITSNLGFDLFDPKPSAGPTPRTDSLTISFQDLPNRDTAKFANYSALLTALTNAAAEPGHYKLRGDASGIIPINTVTINLGPDVNGSPGTATAVLTFLNPLPDDRFTLTIDDAIFDPAGNQLDGESNSAEPRETQNLPSGDGLPGGSFVARFTIDSRPEIGTAGQGGATIDINGNMQFDPTNTDFVNRDLAFDFGLPTDRLFAGKFTVASAINQDGFDRIGAYGLVNSKYRWLLDFTNDGRPEYSVVSGIQVNGTPFSGDFNPARPGDEIGLFDGKKWYFDTNGNNNIDAGDLSFTGTMAGVPIAGDFDGDGKVDIAVHNASTNTFTFDLTSANDGTPGVLDGKGDYTISFNNPAVPNSQTQMFPGVLERPFAGDFNLDGITDIGLLVPNRDGATPASTSEFYIIQSIAAQAAPGTAAALNHQFSPTPLGNDLYGQFGTNVAVPLVGNFDPPVAPTTYPSTGEPRTDPGNPPVADKPAVTIAATDSTAALAAGDQPVNTGTIRITRTGDTTQSLTVSIKASGSGKLGRDYELSVNGVKINGRSVTIAAGEAFVDIVVTPLVVRPNNSRRNLSKSVVLKLVTSKSYQLESAKSATVTISAGQ